MRKKSNLIIVLYGVFFGAIYSIGEYAVIGNSLRGFFAKEHIGQILLRFVAMSVIAMVVFAMLLFLLKKLVDWSEQLQIPSGVSGFYDRLKRIYCWKKGIVAWPILLLGWLPAWIAYYPGVFAYDASTQYAMIRGEMTFTTHQPPIHTWILEFCLWAGEPFGDIDYGIVIYSLSQMIFLSFALSRLLWALHMRCPRIFWIFSFLFLLCNPIVALFSFSTTKDIYFAMFLCGLICEILRWSEGEKGSIAKTILFAVFCCLFRNNFIYAWVIALPFMGIWMQEKKSFWMSGCVSILLVFAVTKLVYPAMGIEKGESAEALSVPIQQLSTVMRNEELSSDEEELITAYINKSVIEIEFNPRRTDMIKREFNNALYDSNPMAFWKVWLHFLVQYPQDFLDAFVALNIQYWWQGADVNDIFTRIPYVEMQVQDSVGRFNFAPMWKDFYQHFVNMEFYEKLFGFRWMFCLATPLWLILGSGAALLIQKKTEYLRCILLLLLYLATFYLGPVSIARYIFPFMVLYPLLIGMPFMREGRREPLHNRADEKM